MTKCLTCAAVAAGALFIQSCNRGKDAALKAEAESLRACEDMAKTGFRHIGATRDQRFQAKVADETAKCRGGQKAARWSVLPWVDWANYWATGDASSLAPTFVKQAKHLGPNGRGLDGALLDLEYQRVELIKFNLFDNNKTYQDYVLGRKGVGGPALKVWNEMQLPPSHPSYQAAGGSLEQTCKGELIRNRTLTGICNDIRNPLMGSTNQLFGRNVEFDTTFPDLGRNQLTKNRHGDRLGLLRPDPQVISRRLFTRKQANPDRCRDGYGMPGYSKEAECDYKKAPFFNVLAAFWIQFMTHDWFSHLEEGHNQPDWMSVGCSEEDAKNLGCRPDDRIDRSFVAESADPSTFSSGGKEYLTRAPKTFRNTVTAWWDASQIYGYDDRSRKRVKRDPGDKAKLLLRPVGSRAGAGEALGYLPLFEAGDPINPDWTGQEATAFPDNWTIGTSFFTTLFAREHNSFVDEFRKQAAKSPEADCGLRNPVRPAQGIRYRDVTRDELFEAARLVVAAEIAKIHTTEWTPQLLYDEPLYKAMNANWSGLFGGDKAVADALSQIITNNFGRAEDVKKATQWYSVFASGPGIFWPGQPRLRRQSLVRVI
jgi:hypothetical protein